MRGTQPMVAGFMLKMKRLQAKEHGRSLEAAKGEEMGSPLGASREERSPTNTEIFSPVRPRSAFQPTDCEIINARCLFFGCARFLLRCSGFL